jgi:hypothetical protein
VGRHHKGDLLPLRVAPPDPLEVRPDGRRAPQRLPDRLGDQLADHHGPLAGDVPEPIAVSRLVLTRDEPEVSPDRLGIPEAMWVVDEGSHRLRRAGADPRDAPQAGDGGRAARLAIQLLLDPPHLPRQRLDLLEQQVSS